MGSMDRLLPSLAEPLLSKKSLRDEDVYDSSDSRGKTDNDILSQKVSTRGEEWRAGIRVSAAMAENLKPLKFVGNVLGQLESLEQAESNCLDEEDELKAGILGVFVVSFDNHVGNTIDWCQSVWDAHRTSSFRGRPSGEFEAFSPHGLEFRALPAGIHNMEEDCLYFRHGSLFGIAAFHRMMLPNSESARKERHARMRSVGALASSLVPLARCLPILCAEAVRQCSPSVQPDSQVLSRLLDRNTQPPAFSPGPPMPGSTWALPIPPPDIFGEFVNEFGVFAITLWKALLLRRRLLFFSPPPMSFSCDLVLSACALLHGTTSSFSRGVTNGSHPSSSPISEWSRSGPAASLLPLFSIGLHDAEILADSPFYVACTSEAILKHKKKLWDVLVEAKDGRWDFTIPSLEMREELRVTPSDRARFRYLCGLKQKARSPTWCAPSLEQFPCSCCPPSQQVYISALDIEQLDRVAAMNESFSQALNSTNENSSVSEGMADLLHSTQMGRGDVKFLQALLQLQLKS